MWGNKSGTGVDPHPFKTWWSSTYTLLSAFLPLKLRIVLSDPFSDVSYLCVAYVYNDFHRTNQNHRSKMGLTSHLSDAYNAFSSSCASFSLLLSPMTMNTTIRTTTVQGPGYFPVRTFRYVLNYPLIESFDCCLVESYLVKSQYFKYLQGSTLRM